MPDLTTVAYWHCESAEQVEVDVTGSRGDVHHVSLGRGNPGDYQYNWNCTCKGFTFRRTCRHVEQVKRDTCGWMQFKDGGEPVEVDGETRCPKCGGPVRAAMWGV